MEEEEIINTGRKKGRRICTVDLAFESQGCRKRYHEEREGEGEKDHETR
jgi:hypothetical protein